MSMPQGRPAVDPTNPASVAGDILARIASYDSTAPVPSPEVIRDWAEMIRAAHIEHRWLVEGVGRVYMDAVEPPKAKLSAVLAAARAARARATQGQALAELAAPSFDEEGPRRSPVVAAYQVDDAIALSCPSCDAGPGEFCGDPEWPRIIPHHTRLALAYRTNHPKGRTQHARRQAHLREHRRTFKPTWKRATT